MTFPPYYAVWMFSTLQFWAHWFGSKLPLLCWSGLPSFQFWYFVCVSLISAHILLCFIGCHFHCSFELIEYSRQFHFINSISESLHTVSFLIGSAGFPSSHTRYFEGLCSFTLVPFVFSWCYFPMSLSDLPLPETSGVFIWVKDDTGFFISLPLRLKDSLGLASFVCKDFSREISSCRAVQVPLLA